MKKEKIVRFHVWEPYYDEFQPLTEWLEFKSKQEALAHLQKLQKEYEPFEVEIESKR